MSLDSPVQKFNPVPAAQAKAQQDVTKSKTLAQKCECVEDNLRAKVQESENKILSELKEDSASFITLLNVILSQNST